MKPFFEITRMMRPILFPTSNALTTPASEQQMPHDELSLLPPMVCGPSLVAESLSLRAPPPPPPPRSRRWNSE